MLFLISFFISSSFGSGKYDEALLKAEEAAYKQSGLEVLVKKAQQYGEDRAKFYIKKTGVEKETVVLGMLLRAYKAQQIAFKVSKNKKVFLQPNGAKLEIYF